MKKIIILLFLISIFSFAPPKSFSEEVTYKNLITDDTTLEEDFEILGMEIDNYSLKEKYRNLEKTYVIGMAESYVDENTIQTYLYIYCPLNHYNGISINEIKYSINDIESVYNVPKHFELDSRGLYKYKAFSYEYKKDSTIKIRNIKTSYLNDNSRKIIEYENESTFLSKNSHNLAQDEFITEINFNSTLVIEDIEVIDIVIPPSSSGFVQLAEILSSPYKSTDISLTFYNFNFPDNIYPDEILKAVFWYDIAYYNKIAGSFKEPSELRREEIRPKPNSDGEYSDDDLGVYIPKTHQFKASKYSTELSFETFTLGNRVELGQFGYVEMKDYKNDFDFDCSVLLGANTKTYSYSYNTTYVEYSQFENINLLELDYMIEGIFYKSQIVAEEHDVDKQVTPAAKENWWQKFKNWFVKNLPLSLILVILSPIIAIALIVLFFMYLPKIIVLLIKIIIWIIKLPFTLFSKIFRRSE